MKIKVDENLPAEATAMLAKAGHDARSVLDQQMGGGPDDELIVVCRNEGRVLVTLDLDFSDIRDYPPGENRGVVVLRLDRQDKPHVLLAIARVVALLERGSVDRRLWIVDEDRVRVRA